jgi:hypothetical protein
VASRAKGWRWTLGILAVLSLLGGSCASAPPPRVHTLPDDAATRDGAVRALGQALWDGIARGDMLATLATDDELEALIDGEANTRLRLRRPGLRARLGERMHTIPPQLTGASYVGICAQDARDHDEASGLGLREPSWVVARVLIAGQVSGSSRRIALWVDGPFVYDGDHFVALELTAIESPRWEHSDLELGSCDVSDGL